MDRSDFFDRMDAITVDRLRQQGGSKWGRYPDLLGAWIAEMDFGVAPAVKGAMRAFVENEAYGYPTFTDRSEMARALAEFSARRHGWQIDPEWVRTTPDVLSVLGAMIDHFSRPGSAVIVPTPAYMPFLTIPALHDREVIQVPMVQDAERWRFDLDALAAAFDAGGHVLVLCNPNNPLGQVFTRDELSEVAEVVEAKGGLVFSDEIHSPLVFGEARHVPYVELDDRTRAHTITATSGSKGFNLPGLKCAQVVIPDPALRARWMERCGAVEDLVGRPGLIAGVAAYDHGEAWLDDVLAYLDRNRRALVDLADRHVPSADYRMPEGTYLTLLHLPELGDDPAAVIRDQAGILLTPGPALGEAGRGYVRLNVATPLPILTDIVERMGAVVRDA